MNRTKSFRTIAEAQYTHSAESITDTQIDTFLDLAYSFSLNLKQVEANLSSIRSKYCRFGHLGISEKDKTQFDFELESFFQNSIKYLEKLESAKSGKNKQTYLICSQICIHLNNELEKLTNEFKELQNQRLLKERERMNLFVDIPVPGYVIPETAYEELELTANERIQLEKENNDLLDLYNGKMAELEKTEQKLREIAELQNILQSHVQEQARDIDMLYEESFTMVSNMNKGNKFLLKAQSNFSDFRKYVLFFLILMSFTLLFLHWIYD